VDNENSNRSDAHEPVHSPQEPQPFPFANLLASSQQGEDNVMTTDNLSEAAKAVVRRNTEDVQGGGNFEVFEELFADDFLDHTPQPGRTPDKDGARQLYKILRTAFHPLAACRW
jgi:hypothetical protein